MKRPRAARWAGVALGVCLSAACATHTAPASSRFIKRGPPAPGSEINIELPKTGQATAAPEPVSTGDPSPEPQSRTPEPPTLEGEDPTLGAAVAAVTSSPSGEAHRALGLHYWQRQVFDRATDEFTKAIALAPKDARNFDARARAWRDAGVPEFALGDAYRAVFLAPKSAEAQNTLGTVLYAVGDRDAARGRFTLARTLDPGAAYAWNNLCYLAFLDGDLTGATDLCGRAAAIDPALPSVRHNMALVHAAAGRMDLTTALFALDPEPARARYNLGIIHAARGEYREAADAFAFACRELATPSDACRRAAQSRERAMGARAAAGGSQ